MRKQIFLYLFLAFLLTACTLNPNEQFIQGVWEIASPDAHTEFFQWRFTPGSFTREQAIERNDLHFTTGRYRIVQSDNDIIILELFDYAGDRISYENNPMTIQIEIDREQDTVRITNVLFVRVSP